MHDRQASTYNGQIRASSPASDDISQLPDSSADQFSHLAAPSSARELTHSPCEEVSQSNQRSDDYSTGQTKHSSELSALAYSTQPTPEYGSAHSKKEIPLVSSLFLLPYHFVVCCALTCIKKIKACLAAIGIIKRENSDLTPAEIATRYDKIIAQRREQIAQYKKSVSTMIAHQVGQEAHLERITQEIGKLEKLKAGVISQAQQMVMKYGEDSRALKSDPLYLRCQNAFREFSDVITERDREVQPLREHLDELKKNLRHHKNQIITLMRELDKMKEEKNETIAAIILAKEESVIAASILDVSSVSETTILEDLRRSTRLTQAKARASRELAKLTPSQQEEEYLRHASIQSAQSEFEQLMKQSSEKQSITNDRNSSLPNSL